MSKEKEAVVLPVITDGLAPKGGIKPAIAKGMRKQGFDWLEDQGYTRTPKGRFAKAVANVDGSTAYFVIDLVVSNDPGLFDMPAEPKVKAKESTEVLDIPDLV